jgi:hypothetical protein
MSEKKYLERRISFINKLGDIPVKASADLLKVIYYAAVILFNYSTRLWPLVNRKHIPLIFSKI